MNRNKLKGMLYYRVECVLDSPLCIGSGRDDITKYDILTDFDGKPFLPGSSLVGVFRAFIRETQGEEAAGQLFGKIIKLSKAGEPQLNIQSPVFLSDAIFMDDVHISIRDGVALDEDNKIAKDGAKYDYQVIEPEVKFQFKVEVEIREQVQKGSDTDPDSLEKTAKNAFDLIFGAVNEGIIRLGYKTNRGLGRFHIDSVQDLFYGNNGQDLKGLPEFQWNSSDFKSYTIPKFCDDRYCKVMVPLKLASPLIIRNYSTNQIADYSMVCRKEKGSGRENGQSADPQKTMADIPVIPGSSWAGLFRHAFQKLLTELGDSKAGAHTVAVFGNEVGEDTISTSAILFEETDVKNNNEPATLFPVTRCAIDRITGSAANGSLYTELVCPKGETVLEIRVKKSDICSDWVIGALLLILHDLMNGYLVLGGETSIGRGLFAPNGRISIDGSDEFDSKKFNLALAQWLKQGGAGNEA